MKRRTHVLKYFATLQFLLNFSWKVFTKQQSIKSLFLIFVGFENILETSITFENNPKISYMTEIIDFRHDKSENRVYKIIKISFIKLRNGHLI